MREEGYYWVRRDDVWLIVEFVRGSWVVRVNPIREDDGVWNEIDERRIERK